MEHRDTLIYEFDFIDHILTFCRKHENISKTDEENRNRLIDFIIYCIDRVFNIDFIYKMIIHLREIDIYHIIKPEKKIELYRQIRCLFDELNSIEKKNEIDLYLIGYIVPPDTP